MRLSALMICLAFAVPCFAAESASGPELLAVVEGEFRSMAALPDGGILLLGKDSLLRIGTDGKPLPIKLPAVPGPRPEEGLTDLAVQGKTLFACRFSDPTLYTLDLEKPDSLKALALSGLPKRRVEFAEIGNLGDRLGLVDADGGRFAVDLNGAASELPPTAIPVSDPDSKPVCLQPPGKDDPTHEWRVTSPEGKTWLSRSDPGKGEYLMKLLPLGFMSDGRLVVLEVTGAGELREKRVLHLVKDGKILASREASAAGPGAAGPGAANPGVSDPGPMVRSQVLLPDGRVALLSRNKAGKLEVLVHKW